MKLDEIRTMAVKGAEILLIDRGNCSFSMVLDRPSEMPVTIPYSQFLKAMEALEKMGWTMFCFQIDRFQMVPPLALYADCFD